ILWIVFVVIVIAIFTFLIFRKGNPEPLNIENDATNEKMSKSGLIPYEEPANASKITGLACNNYDKRAFAVMYSDIDHAYSSGLTQADFVLEMPHRAVHDIPRIMGVFQCNTPEIVGPMRSGRTDHISVAGSLDAIFVPWGGSSVGKELLRKGVIDHIDCNGEVAPAGGSACFRRQGPMSHLSSASSSVPELIKVARENDYRSESQTPTFLHQGNLPIEKRPEHGKVRVKYNKDGYIAEYLYDKQTNSYKRYLFGDPSIDYESKEQHAPKNLITIITKKDAWLTDTNYVAQGLQDPWDGIDAQHRKNDNGGYPNMQLGDPWFDTKYEGEAEFFLNGQHIEGPWKKEKGIDKPFQYFDEKGEEIHFVPGQIWMHVLSHTGGVSYEDEEEYQEALEDGTEDSSME
ncbi:MAG: DUF3048 domain-containing protein, partial [Bacteroidales bacterium]|nr:DUF3048 domain-containing protein [Bacteroidales bacterium]